MPDNPDLAIAAGKRLCGELLEPLCGDLRTRVDSIRVPVIRGEQVLQRPAKKGMKGYTCALDNDARHTWDRLDTRGFMGATACVVISRFVNYQEDWPGVSWQP